ncbi:MAG: hypothetical protein AAFY38_14640 [Pseudomonadota bacterium]
MTKMLTLFAAAGLALTFTTAPALAGDANMRNADGTKLRINCTGAGCKVRQKVKGQKWKVIETGEGGRSNFLVLEAKYKDQGYK